MGLGISLAGGGIKGVAHIGVIKAFEEENIEFDYISGTSSGSIVATLYALGFNSDEMYEIFEKYSKKIKYVEIKNIVKLIYGIFIKRKLIIDGLNSGKTIEKTIKSICEKKKIKTINQISKKILIPSVELNSGKIYIFSSVEKRKFSDQVVYVNDIEIEKAVRASCSYPGFFSPCKYKKELLIDGGIRENIPWKELKSIGAEEVICVTFTEESSHICEKNIVDIIQNSLKILCHELKNYEIEGIENIINIHTKETQLLDMNNIEYFYKLGYVEGKIFIKNWRENEKNK